LRVPALCKDTWKFGNTVILTIAKGVETLRYGRELETIQKIGPD